ncbi:MAG: DUF721 domain-containing protein [Duncaniella sp.]|nr:DUF721 domain-containing protein [Duncaniella sp.]
MKRTYPRHIGSIIDEVMERCGLTDSLNDQRASAIWAEVVGPGINRYTSRRYVDRGVMHVYLTSAPLKNELQFVKERLIEALNKALGAEIVKELIIH